MTTTKVITCGLLTLGIGFSASCTSEERRQTSPPAAPPAVVATSTPTVATHADTSAETVEWLRPAVVWPAFAPETRLTNLRQLTFAGENAEAYWSFDDTALIFQSTHDPLEADQIFTMPRAGGSAQLVSTGAGRTTCGYFLPGNDRVLFASTHLAGPKPPAKPGYDPSLGYVWPVFKSYGIFSARADGSDIQVLIDVADAYDAEATVSPAGDRIVFTSSRDGDLDLYSAALDGSDVRRLTDAPGYDGGAFFSFDGKKIVWRAPKAGTVNADEFRTLLERELVRPDKLEIWVMNADGSEKTMLTDAGAASFAPSWHPDGKRLIFSSNLDDPRGGNFELYMIDIETRNLERITHFERRREGAHRSDDFDGFPLFTRDGKSIVFCSNRHNERPNETNVFVADWVEQSGSTK